jgi:hypothetical protein
VPGKYVVAVYDQTWYAGNSGSRSGEEDVLVNFIGVTWTKGLFQWPREKDDCWVPTEHLLCLLPAPSITTTGWHYRLGNKIVCKIRFFKKFADKHF